MLDYKTIYGSIETPAILEGAVAYARGRVGNAGAITLDVMQEGALAVMKSLAVEKLKPGIESLLENSVAGFQLLNGERPFVGVAPETIMAEEQNAVLAWRDAFDAHLLNDLGADLQKAVGPSAIGEHFTDADVDDADVRGKVAIEMAERLAESAMILNMRDPNNVKVDVAKTLALAGINDTVLAPYTAGGGAAAAPVAEERMIDEPTARAKVEQIVGAYALSVGADNFDPLVLDELLGCAFDDDQFISGGAIERLGGTFADFPYFLAYCKHAPLEAKGNTMAAALTALASGATVEPPKKAGGKKIKVEKAGAPPPKGAVAPPTTTAPPPPPAPPSAPSTTTPGRPASAGTLEPDYASVVSIWRAVGKDTDQSIGTAVGVSRPQISNIASGKAKLPLEPAQRQEVRKLLLHKASELTKAADLLA